MKMARFQITGMVFLVAVALLISGCGQGNDDDDDDDDETNFYGLPESMETCGKSPGKFEPWFEIGGYSDSVVEVFPEQGYGEEMFLPALVSVEGSTVGFVAEDWWLSLDWSTDVVERPFAGGEAVQVSIRYQADSENGGYNIRHLWVLDEAGETVLFDYPDLSSAFAAIEERVYIIEVPLMCQLAQEDEPPLEWKNDWHFVYQRGLTAVVDSVGVRMTTFNTGLEYSVDGRHAFTVTENHIGLIKGLDAVGASAIVSEGTFQMVRLAP